MMCVTCRSLPSSSSFFLFFCLLTSKTCSLEWNDIASSGSRKRERISGTWLHCTTTTTRSDERGSRWEKRVRVNEQSKAMYSRRERERKIREISLVFLPMHIHAGILVSKALFLVSSWPCMCLSAFFCCWLPSTIFGKLCDATALLSPACLAHSLLFPLLLLSLLCSSPHVASPCCDKIEFCPSTLSLPLRLFRHLVASVDCVATQQTGMTYQPSLSPNLSSAFEGPAFCRGVIWLPGSRQKQEISSHEQSAGEMMQQPQQMRHTVRQNRIR